jgi:hypothetical protein
LPKHVVLTTYLLNYINFFKLFKRCCDVQHNDAQHNNMQQNNEKRDTRHSNTEHLVILCHYAENEILKMLW